MKKFISNKKSQTQFKSTKISFKGTSLEAYKNSKLISVKVALKRKQQGKKVTRSTMLLSKKNNRHIPAQAFPLKRHLSANMNEIAKQKKVDIPEFIPLKKKFIEDNIPKDEFHDSDSEISIYEEDLSPLGDKSEDFSDDMSLDFDDVDCQDEEEEENEDEFCLQDALKKMKKKATVGMTLKEFKEIFIPKGKKGNFTQYYYMRLYEKCLQMC